MKPLASPDVGDIRRALDDLIVYLRGPSIVKEVNATVPYDLVVTHDGKAVRLHCRRDYSHRGPKRKIDKFSQDLIAEGWATIRAQTGL